MAGYANKVKMTAMAGVLAVAGLAAMAGSASAATQCDQRGCYTVRCDSYGYCNRTSPYEAVNEPSNGRIYEQRDYVRRQMCDSDGCRDVYVQRAGQSEDNDQGY